MLKSIWVFKQVAISFATVEWQFGLNLDSEFLGAKSGEISERVLAGHVR